MQDDQAQEDRESASQSDETSTPGTSTLEVEKPISDVEDCLLIEKVLDRRGGLLHVVHFLVQSRNLSKCKRACVVM